MKLSVTNKKVLDESPSIVEEVWEYDGGKNERLFARSPEEIGDAVVSVLKEHENAPELHLVQEVSIAVGMPLRVRFHRVKKKEVAI